MYLQLTKLHPSTTVHTHTRMNERDRILSLIEREFDLELLLKYRELEELESEVERGGELRNLIEKLILNGKGWIVQLPTHHSPYT